MCCSRLCSNRCGSARSAVLLRAGQSLLEPRLVTVPGGLQTDGEPHRTSWWPAAWRASRRAPGPSLARHRPYDQCQVAACPSSRFAVNPCGKQYPTSYAETMASWPQFLRADLHSQLAWSRTKWHDVVQSHNRAARGDDDLHTPLGIEATPRSWAARAVQGEGLDALCGGRRWTGGSRRRRRPAGPGQGKGVVRMREPRRRSPLRALGHSATHTDPSWVHGQPT